MKELKTNKTIKGNNTMTFNRLSISIISVIITLALSFGIFSYRIGKYSEKIDNLKVNIVRVERDIKADLEKSERDIKADLEKSERDIKADLDSVEKRKADQNIVELLFKKMDSIEQKLDMLIERSLKEKEREL